MPLNRIKQTSKTLLIEEFCTSDSVPDLYTLLRNEDVKQKSEFYSILEEKLEVRSYKEFVEKFMPSVWEWMEQDPDAAGSCPLKFCYSLEKPVGVSGAHEMKLDQNEFYAMVMDLYSKKSTSGESNLEFDYSRVAELLSPKKVLENAKQLRKDLQYNYHKMLELGEGSRSEKNACIQKINEIRKEIVSQYKDSFTGKIKLALADTESKLAALPDNSEEDRDVITESAQKRLPCKASFDENGDLEIIPIEDNQVEVVDEEGQNDDQQLAMVIGKDFDTYGGEGGAYIRSLVVSNYCGDSTAIVQLDRSELIEKRNQYTQVYKNSQEQFIRAISSAVERMLDVKVFFEQATLQEGKLRAPLIVSNCKANKLVEDEKVKEKFQDFIKETRTETDDYRIWFAIVPAIGDSDFVDKPAVDLKDNAEAIFGDLDFGVKKEKNTVKTQDGDVLVSTSALKAILEILKEGKITTFFNYRANETTGFAKLNSAIIDAYRKKLESVSGNGYAVFCYPNFTVLPKKETAIEIGKTGDDGQEKKEFIDIPGIYVDASYVAAGIVIGSQNPTYLEKKGFKINKNNPCVRFDLEEGDNRFKLLTNMNREGKGAWPSEVEENIGKDKFGFCFCGNTKFYNNEKVRNTYVYVARNMQKDKSGTYEPIYTRLTMDFIMQYLRTESVDNSFTKKMIDKFIEEKIGGWRREAESEKNANNILQDNEDVLLEESDEGYELNVKFKDTEEEFPLDIKIKED